MAESLNFIINFILRAQNARKNALSSLETTLEGVFRTFKNKKNKIKNVLTKKQEGAPTMPKRTIKMKKSTKKADKSPKCPTFETPKLIYFLSFN